MKLRSRCGSNKATVAAAFPRIYGRGRPGPLKYPEGLACCAIFLDRGGAVPASPLGAELSPVADPRICPHLPVAAKFRVGYGVASRKNKNRKTNF